MAPVTRKRSGASATKAGLRASGEALTVVPEGAFRVHTDNAGVVQGVIDALRAKGVTIRAVRPVRPSLEDLFMKAVIDPSTGKELKPGASSAKL